MIFNDKLDMSVLEHNGKCMNNACTARGYRLSVNIHSFVCPLGGNAYSNKGGVLGPLFAKLASHGSRE